MLLTSNNTYAERYLPKFGVPKIRPMPGETFDRNNDLTISKCGKMVYHRDGHITRGSVWSVTSDALIEYDRRNMTRTAFDDCYGDDSRSEDMMLHGDVG